MTTSSFPNRPWSTGGGSGTTSRANSGGGGGGAFIPTVIVLGALLFLFVITANVWTEVLWFDQLEAVRVFWTQWGAQIGVGAVATLILAIVLWLNMKLAYPADGIPEPGAIRNRNLDPYRDGISKYRKLTFYGLPVVLGLIFAAGTGAQWRTVLMFINREPFGMKDPEFGLDVGFFVFTLPMLNFSCPSWSSSLSARGSSRSSCTTCTVASTRPRNRCTSRRRPASTCRSLARSPRSLLPAGSGCPDTSSSLATTTASWCVVHRRASIHPRSRNHDRHLRHHRGYLRMGCC